MAANNNNILISGAGPSGLSLAIFLATQGIQPRIIDKKPGISAYSKAFAVNPRTLTILDECGIADRFINNGRKMQAMNIWHNGKILFRNDFTGTPHKFPFLLIQSQRDSELILRDALSSLGINVEYGIQFESFAKTERRYVSTLKNGETSQYTSDFLIGADGTRSEVRTQLGIESDKLPYRDTWELYDVELDVDIPQDDANLFIFREGGMLMIRIKNNLWRLAGSPENLLHYLPKNTKVGTIAWTTKFNIGHRIAQSLFKENAILIGDAAHIHSPLGGRGMNLGVEDAYIVSNLFKEGRLHEYTAERLPYLKKTIGRINTLTQMVAGQSAISRFRRSSAFLAKPFFPLMRPLLRNFVLGLG